MPRSSRDSWVWVDFENTPHVLYLEPFIRRLDAAGIRVGLTAKPQAQTLELAVVRGLQPEAVGTGDFVGLMRKAVGGLRRAAALVQWVRRRGKPKLLISSSRSASLAAWFLGVPGVTLLDYEHAEQTALSLASQVMWLPDLLQHVALPARTRRVARFFPGLKENLYLDQWPIDRAAQRTALELADDDYLVVARPPAEEAHYSSQHSIDLWLRAMRGLLGRRNVRAKVLARTESQRRELAQTLAPGRWLEFVPRAVAGPELVAAADLVLGGGGTMNREAAVLGVPVWSVFTGPAPQIDERLAVEGRLRWVRSQVDLNGALMELPNELGAPRAPFPDGIEAIMADIERRL